MITFHCLYMVHNSSEFVQIEIVITTGFCHIPTVRRVWREQRWRSFNYRCAHFQINLTYLLHIETVKSFVYRDFGMGCWQGMIEVDP
jgi:hypothetical protein